MALAKQFRFGGNRSLQFRFQVFNVFNAVIINDRNRNVIYRSPTDLTVVNSHTSRMVRSIRRGSRRGTPGSAPQRARSRCATCRCRFGSRSSVRRRLVWVVAASLIMGGAARDRHQDTAAPAADAGALISKYCLTCHNDQLKTAGLSLQNIELANVSEHAAVWEKVARKLRSGEMPPSNVRARPDPRAAALVVTQLEDALDRAAAAHPDPGRAPVHRLNRAEYSNAVRDLLAVDVAPGRVAAGRRFRLRVRQHRGRAVDLSGAARSLHGGRAQESAGSPSAI